MQKKSKDLRPAVTEVYKQILKDLELAGINKSYRFSEPVDYSHLQEQIKRFLELQMRSNPASLKQWLYTADVPEKNIAALSKNNLDQTLDELADLLIRRTELKVVLRLRYSEKGKNELE